MSLRGPQAFTTTSQDGEHGEVYEHYYKPDKRGDQRLELIRQRSTPGCY